MYACMYAYTASNTFTHTSLASQVQAMSTRGLFIYMRAYTNTHIMKCMNSELTHISLAWRGPTQRTCRVFVKSEGRNSTCTACAWTAGTTAQCPPMHVIYVCMSVLCMCMLEVHLCLDTIRNFYAWFRVNVCVCVCIYDCENSLHVSRTYMCWFGVV